jgi:hypothetical protein
MAHSYRSYTGAHREDRVGGPVQEGTPLYASAHVQAGHLPSRRDDLFSVGLVVAELLIRVHAAQLGTTSQYETSTGKKANAGHDGAPATYLPWASEKSEAAMAASVQSQVFDRNSALYRRLPKAAAPVFLAYFERVHAVGYNKMPPYDDLIRLVQDVTVPCATAAALPLSGRGKETPSSARAASMSPAQGGGRRRRSESGSDDAAGEGPASRQQLKPAPAAARPRTTRPSSAAASSPLAAKGRAAADSAAASGIQPGSKRARQPPATDPSSAKARRSERHGTAPSAAKAVCEYGDSDDEMADDEIEMMEVDEDEVVEVFPGVEESKKRAAPKNKKHAPGIELQVVGGPGTGTSFHLIKGVREVLEIGFKPNAPISLTTDGRKMVVSIPDPDLSRVHAKLSLLVTSGRTRLLEVHNLCEKEGGGSSGCRSSKSVHVNNKPVLTKLQAFYGDKIRLGSSTVLRVASYDGPVPALEKENVVRRASHARTASS